MERSLQKQEDSFRDVLRKKPRRKLFYRIDALIGANNRFMGNAWNGRRYAITIRMARSGKERVFLSSMPYDKIVDARNIPLG